MNKEQRIKEGFVGKRVSTNPETGGQIIIDFDDEESGHVLTMEEFVRRNSGLKTFSKED